MLYFVIYVFDNLCDGVIGLVCVYVYIYHIFFFTEVLILLVPNSCPSNVPLIKKRGLSLRPIQCW